MNRRRLRGKFERETRLSRSRVHACAGAEAASNCHHASQQKPLALAAIDLATRVNDVAALLGALPGRMVGNPESAGRPYFVRKQRFGNLPVVAMVTGGA